MHLLVLLALLVASVAAVTPAHAAEPAKTKLQHVVSFKFKDGLAAEKIKEVEDAFRALKAKIPVIRELQWGTNNSPEGLNKGFTHCWILTFSSEADRDAYLIHPDHKVFTQLVPDRLADVFVVDFWVKE